MHETVGFIGLGMMGRPMGHRLAQAGYALLVHDLNVAQARSFCEEAPSARVAASATDFAQADVLVTMLPDSAAVESALLGKTGVARHLPRGSVVIDMSSSAPARTRALAEVLATHGIAMLDAPVSGGVRRATDGTLAIMAGGPREVFDAQLPLLARMGKSVTHVGGPGAGHAVKALNNYVSAAGLVAISEALVAAHAFGLDPAIVNTVINSSTGRNNSTENKVRQFMLSGTWDAGFSLRLMDKDLTTAMEMARGLGRPMALGEQLLALWHEAAATLPPTADHTEIYRHLLAAASGAEASKVNSS